MSFWGPEPGRSKNDLVALGPTFSGPLAGGFTARLASTDLGVKPARPVLDSEWKVVVHRPPGKPGKAPYFLFDLDWTDKAAGASPLILPEYRYGGLGVRGNRAWIDATQVAFLTSEGADRLAGENTRARWVHLGGELPGKGKATAKAGLAVLVHPLNLRAPEPVRLNPGIPLLCVSPVKAGPMRIEAGKPVLCPLPLRGGGRAGQPGPAGTSVARLRPGAGGQGGHARLGSAPLRLRSPLSIWSSISVDTRDRFERKLHGNFPRASRSCAYGAIHSDARTNPSPRGTIPACLVRSCSPRPRSTAGEMPAWLAMASSGGRPYLCRLQALPMPLATPQGTARRIQSATRGLRRLPRRHLAAGIGLALVDQRLLLVERPTAGVSLADLLPGAFPADSACLIVQHLARVLAALRRRGLDALVAGRLAPRARAHRLERRGRSCWAPGWRSPGGRACWRRRCPSCPPPPASRRRPQDVRALGVLLWELLSGQELRRHDRQRERRPERPAAIRSAPGAAAPAVRGDRPGAGAAARSTLRLDPGAGARAGRVLARALAGAAVSAAHAGAADGRGPGPARAGGPDAGGRPRAGGARGDGRRRRRRSASAAGRWCGPPPPRPAPWRGWRC